MKATATAPKLLVVDDEPVVCESCTRIFRELGFNVEASPDAEQALDRALAGGYNAILLDIRLPGMDGLEFLQKLRSADSRVPVIIITGYSSVANASAAMRLGATDFIPKPFTPDEIVQAVTRLLPPEPAAPETTAPRRIAPEWTPASESLLFGGESWVHQGADGTVRVGTLLAPDPTGRPHRLRFAEVGEVVYRGLPVAALELPDGTLRMIASPVSGKVIATNAAVADRPALLHQDPCGAGWLARLEPLRLEDDLRRCAPRTAVLASTDELFARRELARLGTRLRVARTVEDTIRCLRESGSSPLLVDAVSLGADGPKLVGTVNEAVPGTRVVVLAAAGQSTETAYRRQGIFYYVVEAFSDGEIAELMQVLFAPPARFAATRPAAPGLPKWVRKICIINRRGEQSCLLASKGALQEQSGVGAHLLRAIREAAVPVQVTLGHGSVSAIDVQREAGKVQRLVVLSVDKQGRLTGSLTRQTGEEITSIAGEYRHRVALFSVQPGAAEGLMLDVGTAEALAEHILAELL
jgi:CheY-like chemotaxis protein/glycine cleavage system H lipoate-binding protein